MVEPKVHRLPVIRPAMKKVQKTPQQVPIMLPRIPTRIRAPPLIVGRLSSAQRLRREKTFGSASTPLGKALGEVELDLLTVSDLQVGEVLEKTNSFLYTITHRINKNRHSLKFGDPYFCGPVVDGLLTKYNYSQLNVYFPLKLKDFRLKDAHDGYTNIYMSRNPSFDRYQSIRSDAHRNLVSPIKVSAAIHELMTHICQSVGRGTVLPFHSNSSEYNEGTHQIVVILDGYIRLTIVPALHQKLLRREEDETIHVAKPYYFDNDPDSDTTWRYDNPNRAKRLLQAMYRADRGNRNRALRLLHICCYLDPILRLFPQDFVTMVLFGTFDEDVDQIPFWQTLDLEKCFLNVLTHWQQHMTSGTLQHPFTAGLNILSGMDEIRRIQVRNRITRLLGNKRELLRLLTRDRERRPPPN